ncbi:MAG: DUF4286 family protein [Thermodesulfobacteriota bacterium]
MDNKQKVLLVVMADVDPKHEEDLNRWYNEEHLPMLLKVPGVLSARRYKVAPETESHGTSPTGRPQKYIAIYEHETTEVQNTEAYEKARSTPWANRVRPYVKNLFRQFYVQTFPPDDTKMPR